MEKSEIFFRTDGCIRLAKSNLSSSDFRVFMALVGVIDKDNYFSMTVGARKRLALRLGVTPRTVYDSLGRLMQKDLIAKDEWGEYMMNPEIAHKTDLMGVESLMIEYREIKPRNNHKIEDDEREN